MNQQQGWKAYGPPFEAWGLCTPHTVELIGASGAGKTRCAMQMAVNAAQRVGVLYCAADEGHSRALAERVKRAAGRRTTPRHLRVSDARNLAELADDLKDAEARLVVVDSITGFGAAPEQVAELLVGRSWIVVSQSHAKRRADQDTAFSHMVDAVIEISSGTATPLKNRFGSMKSINVCERSAG